PIVDPRHFTLDTALDAHNAVEQGTSVGKNRNRRCNIVQAGLEKNKEKPIQTLVIEANGRITFPQMTTGTYF
ncbi:hypothetical protein, partial [Nostoc sp. 'Peltigera malacea cyanobiont' DB3992]|uniref:hypothetical protein n=1 Tax=Nostoc sp. 'Peltigera malacea cyanobiont' DB3992 TaxID=1206980 RepID=UPI000C061288